MKSRDMTQGSILRQLVLFSIPVLLGNLLQQLYNAADAIIVGNFVSNEALAAVGSSGTLINMIIAFFIGMSTGASVLISQHFGARDEKSLHDTVHTAAALSLLMGVVLALAGIFISPVLLRLINTPEKIFLEATEYLRIYFAGLPALTVYNMGAATLTAIGDSKRPLYFLTVSAIINVALNLLFVTRFHMGIAGVGWSTVIAEVISAVLVTLVLCRTTQGYKLILRDLRIHRYILQGIVKIGLPGGIQAAIISFSNTLVQAYINGLGADIVAGYSASNKLDAFIMLPVQAMSLVATTFVAQNLGAHQVKRARQGTKVSMALGLGITVAISVIVLLFGTTLLRIFSPDPVVLDYGMQFMRVFVPTYFLLCFTQIIPGALRGAGDVRVPTITCIGCFVVVRQIYLFIVTKFHYTLTTVALGYPVTWALASLILCLYYRRSDWSRFGLPGAAEQPPAAEAVKPGA